MELSAQEIQQNIEKLRNRIGDARTGGKGSQRRKVKVVTKQAVLSLAFRLVETKLSRTSSRRSEHISSALMRSTSSRMMVLSSTSETHKVVVPKHSLRIDTEQHLHCDRRLRDKDT